MLEDSYSLYCVAWLCGLIHCEYIDLKISRPVRSNVKGCSLVFVSWFILRHCQYLTVCDFTETLVAYLRHSPRIFFLGERKVKSASVTGVGRDSNRHLPNTRLELKPIHTTAWFTSLHWCSENWALRVSGILGCYAEDQGCWFLTFRRNVSASFLRMWNDFFIPVVVLDPWRRKGCVLLKRWEQCFWYSA